MKMRREDFRRKLCKTLCVGLEISLCLILTVGYSFGETLEQAWEIAIRENNQLKAKQQIVAATDAGQDAARAARMPKVTNATSYTVLSSRPEYELDFSPALNAAEQMFPPLAPIIQQLPTAVDLPVANQNFMVSTTQAILPIYTGGKITSLIDQAQARAEQARYDAHIDLLDLKMGVTENYLLVLRLNRIVQVLHETQSELDQHVQHTAALVQKGVITENIHLAAQVSKAEIDQQILHAEQGFDLSKSAYNRYLARPLDTPVHLEPMGLQPLSGDLEIQTQIALENRPELKALASKAVESEAKSREYRSERLPNMAVAGGYTYLENDSLAENNYASASVCMVWTPIDGGVSRSKQRAAMHQMTAVNRMRDEARSGIELQVRQAWLNEREARGRLEVARTAVTQATRNLEIVRKQFEEGVSPHSDYLQAVSLKTQADVNLANALCDAILASYKVRRATGTI